MKREVFRHVAIWIDAHEAILLAFEAELLEGSTLHRPGEGWSHERVDAQQYPSTQQYYKAVLSHLRPQDEILILGPGWAKSQLGQLIECHDGLWGKVVELHDASRLAEPELVFPTDEVWRIEKEHDVSHEPGPIASPQ